MGTCALAHGWAHGQSGLWARGHMCTRAPVHSRTCALLCTCAPAHLRTWHLRTEYLRACARVDSQRTSAAHQPGAQAHQPRCAMDARSVVSADASSRAGGMSDSDSSATPCIEKDSMCELCGRSRTTRNPLRVLNLIRRKKSSHLSARTSTVHARARCVRCVCCACYVCGCVQLCFPGT